MDVTIPERALHELYVTPYADAVDAGAGWLMVVSPP